MILCIMQFVPSSNGHGGAQRSWFILSALARLAPVHLVVIQPASSSGIPDESLAEARRCAASVTIISVREWNAAPGRWSRMPKDMRQWLALCRLGSVDAPQFSSVVLAKVAAQLPSTKPDLIFAGRLGTGTIVDQLIARGALPNCPKVLDFDDIFSRFRRRALRARPHGLRIDRWLRDQLEILHLFRAEAKALRRWTAVSVCSREDVALLEQRHAAARISYLPNVVDRALLPEAKADPFTLLFVGNLGFAPNAHGLQRFLNEAWPAIVVRCPGIRLVVVGFKAGESLNAMLRALGIEHYSDAQSVDPFYAQCDAVLIPIFFGSGTRIKAVEAMAFGRPIISTAIGIEGLGVRDGQHAIIANEMTAFAEGVVALASSPDLRRHLRHEGRRLYEARFQPEALLEAVNEFVSPHIRKSSETHVTVSNATSAGLPSAETDGVRHR